MQTAEQLSPTVQHDGNVVIAVGRSRKELSWKNQEKKWSEIVDRFSRTKRTPETYAEYMQMPKAQQDEIKDVGGYVGGAVKDGKRKSGSVAFRQLITLDIDFVSTDVWFDFTLQFTCSAVLHSTHKHSPTNKRYRIIMPLSRPVNAEEYQAVSRYVAERVGIDQLDGTTFEFERLMYFPSTSIDGEYVFEFQDGAWLNVDAILSQYDDWRNPFSWASTRGEKSDRQKQAERLGDPLSKSGVVGAFCRAYTIQDAIEAFLDSKYQPCKGMTDRYTYIDGSTTGGLVIYEDKYAYSHHGTDPISGKTVNAFDLVRLHLFSSLDDDTEEGTPITRLPSFKKMIELATNDDLVKQITASETFSKADEKTSKLENLDSEEDWVSQLDMNKQGGFAATFQNLFIILWKDPQLANKIAYNAFSYRKTVLDDLPWRTKAVGDMWTDRDDSELRGYMETYYGISAPSKLNDALEAITGRLQFHPVRDYLNSLSWDGEGRVERLLVDYLGADDTPYTRAVTRKMMAAAVARVFVPAIKYDQMLVLVGEQGVGKSTLFSRLAGKWFSDSLTSVQGKEAYEQIQGQWIVEMGELSATKRADVEAIKHFLSKCHDTFRAAYGRNTSTYARQCIFVGTTNDRGYLRDRTGNRRFWSVPVNKSAIKLNLFKDLTQHEIDQLWAEAVQLFREGETLYLEADLVEESNRIQMEHTEETPLFGLIREFLDRKLPEDWKDRDVIDRRRFYKDPLSEQGTVARDRVCSLEIWCEMMGGDISRVPAFELRQINDCLRQMEDYEPVSSMKFGALYGTQRGFRIRQMKS
jgi:predicted P-loop ATPase